MSETEDDEQSGNETLGENKATYIRRSTEKQEDEHQRADIKRWLDYQGHEFGEVEIYAEAASGASHDRDEFQRLIDNVKAGEVDDVIVWEISRIARNGLLAQEFFEACEENDVTIHVTNGAVRKVEPDGHGRLVADIVAAVAAEERRRLIERTKAAQRRARYEGKWLGRPPAGFVTSEEGYLKPNLDPDYDEGETGFFDIQSALEDIDADASYSQVARDTPNISRPALSNIDQDDQKRRWYMSHEAEDDRVASALEEVEDADYDGKWSGNE
jgi:DNA invertase Pin-like site-specific DNA recombinase